MSRRRETRDRDVVHEQKAMGEYPPTTGRPRGLLTWDQIPTWMRDNEHVLKYYRPPNGSFKQCFASVLGLHNETINIHSHLLGSLLFFSLPAWTYTTVFKEYPSTNYYDMAVFSTFYFGVAICFLLSSSFHVINCHSQRINVFGNQLDYLGIVLLMWGATIPSVYYGFHDIVKLRNIYWTVVSVLGGLCCAASVHPKFRTPALRPYRSAMYACLGLSGLVFMTHCVVIYGFAEANRRMSLDWMGLMGLFNMLGAVAYGARIPERLSPGKFDLYGSSHQILHVAVIFAGLAHMFGVLRAFRYYHNTFPTLFRASAL